MKNLLIIGARGYGREVFNIAQGAHGYGETFKIKGFLDNNKNALKGFDNYPEIISSVEDYQIGKDDVFVCALGDVSYKKKYIQIILEKGGDFFTLIHKSAFVGLNTKIGKGCIVAYDAHISCDVQVKDFVTVMTGAIIGHDAHIGTWSSLGVRTFIGGMTSVSEGVTIHTGAIILPKKQIESDSVIAAGAVVFRNVKQGTTVIGNPAKKL